MKFYNIKLNLDCAFYGILYVCFSFVFLSPSASLHPTGVNEFKANVEEDEAERDGIDREQLEKERRGVRWHLVSKALLFAPKCLQQIRVMPCTQETFTLVFGCLKGITDIKKN